MQFWNEMEGKTVGGHFVLGSLVRTAGRSAWFETRDDQQRPRVIVVTESLNDEERLLKDLRSASQIHHPNVVAIETIGESRVDDKPVVYAVLEPTEENLGEVLRERALTPTETTQITESLVAGLAAVHAAGLFHGHVNTMNVLASGDTVKLRSDCLQNIPAAARSESFSQDTGDLAATVFEALTQRKLTSPDDPAIDRLPAPFRLIVKNAVSGNWGLGEIAAALKPGASLPPAAVPAPKTNQIPPASSTVPAAATVAASQPSPVKPVPTKPAAATPVQPKPAPAARAPEKLVAEVKTLPTTASNEPVGAPAGRGSAVRLLAILALVIALGLIWYFYRSTSRVSDSAASAPPATPSQPEMPAAAPSSPPTASPTPAPAKPSSVHKPAAAVTRPPSPVSPTPLAAAAPVAAGQQVWRVVVYAYGRQAEAEQKAASIQAEHAELNPQVFSPNGHGPWLVTLGGAMSRADAIHMSNQVKSKGMPADSYAQNFTH